MCHELVNLKSQIGTASVIIPSYIHIYIFTSYIPKRGGRNIAKHLIYEILKLLFRERYHLSKFTVEWFRALFDIHTIMRHNFRGLLTSWKFEFVEYNSSNLMRFLSFCAMESRALLFGMNTRPSIFENVLTCC